MGARKGIPGRVVSQRGGNACGVPRLRGSGAGVRARERSERATRVRESGGCGSRPARAGPGVWAVRCGKKGWRKCGRAGESGPGDARETGPVRKGEGARGEAGPGSCGLGRCGILGWVSRECWAGSGLSLGWVFWVSFLFYFLSLLYF